MTRGLVVWLDPVQVEKWDGDRDSGKFAGLGAGEKEH